MSSPYSDGKNQKQKPKNWKDLTKKENYKKTFPMNILNVILLKKTSKTHADLISRMKVCINL